MNSKHILNFVSLLFIFNFYGCSEVENNVSIIPKIEFQDLYFVNHDYYQSLTLELIVEDGDRDIGFYDYVDEPYNYLNYFKKPDGELLQYSDRLIPPYDTLPPFEFPYNCTNYSLEINKNHQQDTFYIEKNINHFNIFVDFYVKKNGKFELFDWVTWAPPHCIDNYNGRIWKVKNNPFGSETIKYAMGGTGFPVIFNRDSVKIKVQIQDRAFNRSNIEETFTFIMSDLEIRS
jgi:hypothetical protein